MKIFVKKFFFLMIAALFITNNGCDELTTLPIKIPSEPIYFLATGDDDSSFDEGTECLSSSDEWADNVDDIESVEFIEASFWTDSLTTAGLVGDVTLTVREENAAGRLLFDWNYPDLVAADHIGNPLKIDLDEDEIAILNEYLGRYNETGNICFYGSLETTNITGDGPPFTINAHVIFVIEATIKTD